MIRKQRSEVNKMPFLYRQQHLILQHTAVFIQGLIIVQSLGAEESLIDPSTVLLNTSAVFLTGTKWTATCCQLLGDTTFCSFASPRGDEMSEPAWCCHCQCLLPRRGMRMRKPLNSCVQTEAAFMNLQRHHAAKWHSTVIYVILDRRVCLPCLIRFRLL